MRSHKRLQSLADAVRDCQVTYHTRCHTRADPRQLADMRSAHGNSNYVASLLTDLKPDTQILHYAPHCPQVQVSHHDGGQHELHSPRVSLYESPQVYKSMSLRSPTSPQAQRGLLPRLLLPQESLRDSSAPRLSTQLAGSQGLHKVCLL